MKVLLLLHELSLTGAPRVILDAFEAFGAEVSLRVVALRGGPLAERCARLSIPFVPEPPAYGRLNRLRAAPGAARNRRFSAALASWKPDLLYVNSVAALPLVRQMSLPDAPMLLHVHELDVVLEKLMRGLDPELLSRRPHRYLAVSEPVRRLLIEKYKAPSERTELIHEFVPDRLLNRAAAGSTDPQRPMLIGGAGTPEWRKGTVLWLQMAAELVRLVGRDRVRFRWVGLRDDDESLYFTEMIHKLGLRDVVETALVTPDPYAHFVQFDLFAMTSWEDPCPIVVLENMAFGTPVACFAGSGGAPEAVGPTGLVVNDFSPRAMACAISELVDDRGRRAALGQAARERIRSEYVASVTAPRIFAAMQRAVAS